MKDHDEIPAMQQELEKLQRQLLQQQQRIHELQQQMSRLSASVPPPAVPARNMQWSIENFIGLKLIQFIGIIVLVIGLSIGVKYAIDKELISEFMRIALAYAAGLLLYLLSIRLKKNYVVFSALLFSGGMASLYFTTYAAYSYYTMLPFGVSFLLMIIIAVFTVYKAIVYNRQEIAWLGLVGAYGIPFLISKNSERADLFFMYISIVNLAVVFLCIRKKWKTVGRVAQAITWILFLAWASTRYNPALQLTGAAFLVFFFLLFLFNAISTRLFYHQQLTINDTYQVVLNNLALYAGSLFIFGTGFTDASVAMITFIVSVFCALQSFLLYAIWNEERHASRMMASLSLILFVLFIGYNWNGFTVTFLWLLTAVVIFICGFRFRSVPARMAAMILVGITLAKLVLLDSLTFSTIQKVIAYLALGILLLLFSFFYQKFREKIFEGKD